MLLTALGLAALGFFVSPRASAQVAVLTQNNDNARTGANTAEAILTPANVAGGHFGKLFTLTGLDASVNGQALYVPGVSISGAMHNVLYAYTSDNRDHSNCGLNAFDADTGAPLWHTLLPLSATYTTAAPVIDPATGTLYVLTKTDNDDTGQTFLRAFDITTGAEKIGSPVQVQAGAAGTGDGSVNGRVSFDGPAASGRFHANDRPGLLLLNGVVYTAFAHNSDSFPYHGWILGYKYDGTRFTQTAAFCTTPNGGEGGIWQAGKGLAADAAGFLYCSVGNGTFDADTKGITPGTDYGMCYLKLRASDLTVVDWFAPFDERGLSNSDLDLGNSGLVGIPGTTRLFGGGTKFGAGFLLDSGSLGRFTANGPDKALLRLDGLTGNDSVGQNPVAWDAGGVKYVYLWANGSNVEQFRYDPAGTFSPAGIYKQSSGLTSGGSLAVSSSGTAGGLLWGVGADGVVRAFDATDVSKAPVWTSALNAARDGLGSPGHFQFPTVVNGRVYVPTSGRTIAVYGLLATAPPPGSLVNDTDGNVVYTGAGWFYSAGRNLGDFGDDVHATTNNGDSVSYTFTGTAVSYISETYADEGNVQVYLDGALQATINCASAARKAQQNLWSKTGLSSGSHTLRLVKQDGSYMLLDALSVVATPSAPTGLRATPGNASVTLVWNTISGAASYSVYRAAVSGGETLLKSGLTAASYTDTGLSNGTTYFYQVTATNGVGESVKSAEVSALPAAPTAVLNDTASGITYAGSSWNYSAGRGLGDYQGDVHYATANGDSLSYTFTGTGVSYVTETYSDEGNVDVFLDGVFQSTVSCVSATRHVGQTVWAATGLNNGTHTLRLVKRSGTFMLLDSISTITGGTAP